jgi:hypothetical protein
LRQNLLQKRHGSSQVVGKPLKYSASRLKNLAIIAKIRVVAAPLWRGEACLADAVTAARTQLDHSGGEF